MGYSKCIHLHRPSPGYRYLDADCVSGPRTSISAVICFCRARSARTAALCSRCRVVSSVSSALACCSSLRQSCNAPPPLLELKLQAMYEQQMRVLAHRRRAAFFRRVRQKRVHGPQWYLLVHRVERLARGNLCLKLRALVYEVLQLACGRVDLVARRAHLRTRRGLRRVCRAVRGLELRKRLCALH